LADCAEILAPIRGGRASSDRFTKGSVSIFGSKGAIEAAQMSELFATIERALEGTNRSQYLQKLQNLCGHENIAHHAFNDFRIFENSGEQEIRYFSSEDVPISIDVIFDLSGSVANKAAKAREAIPL
jgi:hypothetical protein